MKLDEAIVRFGPGYIELKDIYLIEFRRLGATIQPILAYKAPYPSPAAPALAMRPSMMTRTAVPRGMIEATGFEVDADNFPRPMSTKRLNYL